MAVKDILGRWGEDQAVGRLEAAGLTVIERNWRCSHGEIDIIAVDGSCVVVCEVKTRSGDGFGTPAEAVDRRKVLRLRRVASCWLTAHPAATGRRDVRFDVVAVNRGRGGLRVEHLRDVVR